MDRAGSVSSSTLALHFEQDSTVGSKTAPHIGHSFGGDACSTSHGSGGVFAEGGTSGGCGFTSARNSGRAFLGLLSCRMIDTFSTRTSREASAAVHGPGSNRRRQVSPCARSLTRVALIT